MWVQDVKEEEWTGEEKCREEKMGVRTVPMRIGEVSQS